MKESLIRRIITERDRAVWWWLLIALVAGVCTWQTPHFGAVQACVGAGCAKIYAAQGDYRGIALGIQIIYLALVAACLVIYGLRLRFTESSVLAKGWHFWFGLALFLISVSWAGGMVSWTQQISSTTFRFVQVTSGFGPFIGIVASVAIIRGGYILKGGNSYSRLLKLLVFSPDRSA